MPQILFNMARGTGTNLLRQFLGWIDVVVYNLISILMQSIFDLADFTLSQDLFDKIISKIYLILAVFMMFKIIVSLLTYLVNPDTMADKERGVGKMVTRVILVLVMLVMLPTAFDLLTEAQKPILRTLPRVILGTSTYSDSSGTNSLASKVASGVNPISNEKTATSH